jgi:hypothetical protein
VRALALVPLGLVTGFASVWVSGWWWGLALSALATLATLAWVPPGWRVVYAVPWLVPAAYFSLSRPEGDFVVESSARGWCFLGLGALVIVVSIVTLPRRRLD